MALHWILLFAVVIFIGLIAWHSSRFSSTTLKKIFDHRGGERSDEVLGLDTEEPATILTLNIKAPEGEAFAGESFESLFREVGLYFGKHNIFHYEMDREGDFFPVFSLASAFEPGYFDMNTIGEYATPGLTLFMECSEYASPREVFELMLATAKTLSDKLGGVLCDDQWLPLNDHAIERYHQKLGV
jgi:cell division protein ZipA